MHIQSRGHTQETPWGCAFTLTGTQTDGQINMRKLLNTPTHLHPTSLLFPLSLEESGCDLMGSMRHPPLTVNLMHEPAFAGIYAGMIGTPM